MLKLECATITLVMDVICANLLHNQFLFNLSTLILFHNGTFNKGATLIDHLGEWFLVNARKMCFYNNTDSDILTSSSVSAVGVLGKLILQVTDSLLLRQNGGLQILNLLQQPLKQLRLDRRRGERRTKRTRKKKGKKTVTGREKLRIKKNRKRKNRSRTVSN